MDPRVVVLFIPIVAIVFGCGIPISAIFLTHLRKLAEIKANSAEGSNEALRAELRELRREMEALRDNSTRFDLSFDAELTRIEERVARVEESKPVGTAQYGEGQYGRTVSAVSAADKPAVLTVSSRG